MTDLLINPVYNALMTGDPMLGSGKGNVRFFDKEISPFAGFETGYIKGFEDLHQLLPEGRNILFATPDKIPEPTSWKTMVMVEGLQFIFHGTSSDLNFISEIMPVPLDTLHVSQMMELAALTKPGPFNSRTIEFGNYFGIFHEDKLAAMTGQRLHVSNHSEISAVCTHPDHSGKGYARILLQHQVKLILNNKQTPFLHVRADNERAINLYEQTGFKVSRPMNFYFLKNSA